MVDVTVVGSGPNGLAAAVTAARAGLSVRIVEASDQLGGGLRSAELVESGFLHDVCAAVHPMALASPFFREVNLSSRVEFRTPELSYAHLIRPGESGLAWRDLERTAAGLGRDGGRWRFLFEPLVRDSAHVFRATLNAPLAAAPRDYLRLVAVGVRAGLVRGGRGWFSDERAAGLMAGLAAHSCQNPTALASSLIGVTLGVAAHADGWPVVVGGSQSIASALIIELRSLGVVFETGQTVTDIRDTADSPIVLLDVTPRSFADMASSQLDARVTRAYRRFRYGPGVAKVDITLDGAVPWSDPSIAQAGTVHFGGSAAEIVHSEREVIAGRYPDNPFILLSQPTVFDPSRAPAGKHTVWAYTHVPSGSARDQTDVIVRTIEAHAPGFRDLIRGIHHTSAEQYSHYNLSYVGGDINGGANTLRQIVARPRLGASPWRTPLLGVYLCSASTAPGPGVHGMAGHLAAKAAIADRYRVASL
ncbi:MAG: hypothetical protein B5766_10050 [Candidatus Lumbricidophila eiseniae]|uniref:Pyridine nucleotide-disulfide oxidoreductase domain-containing protein 2 n=1 Tax=Candidatus Lumbricidiphila eiseniae TaxID=1969409 RepID=A0A2A6FPQ0_9MICO|nr:MAG: hypothetical protein B5766_10050 [Candidatus Lumbricidophila eiseniae]